jgi:formate hydrogenlyase subunit 3/multisubunit Na+/H+ antiporter MnhD subunit
VSFAALVAVATIAAFAFPLFLSACMAVRALRPTAARLAPWAATPALVLAVSPHGLGTVGWSWALLGVRLGSAGPVTSGFLFVTACLWLASGVFARTYLAEDPARARFWGFFLLTASGNLGLVVARDVASFYFFYVLMTFAAYGLVVHAGSPEARRAGRVYVVMALAGEMLLLTALLLTVRAGINAGIEDVPRLVAASSRREIIAVLVLLGFGVKAGAPLLHMWLPLAHPVAPTPASAVLSGAMIKAGLLGWLQFLPLGIVALPIHGLACVVAGLVSAFLAVALGLTQRDPKTILAYSSVSQMGFMLATVGIALTVREAAPAAVLATLFYAMNHALAKGALFLGTAVARATASGWPARLVTLGLAWLGLSIAGAPLSSGALAKISVKAAAARGAWGALPLPLLLSLAAVASTLIMVHFLRQTVPRPAERRAPAGGLWIPWASLLVLDVVLLVWPGVARAELALLVRPDKVWAAAWPVVAGVVVAIGVARLRRARDEDGGRAARREVPAGDVLHVVELALSRVRSAARTAESSAAPLASLPDRLRASSALLGDRLLGWAERTEGALGAFATIGLLFLVLVFVVLAGQTR